MICKGNVKERLKKSLLKERKNQYLWKCFLNRKNQNFVAHVLEWIDSPYDIQILHMGDCNRGKIIYVITEQGDNWGFFAEFRAVLVKLLYADRLGFVPVVVFGNRFKYFEENGVQGEMNAYCYYFEQTMPVDNIFCSENVVWGKLLHSHCLEKEYGNKGYITNERFRTDLAFVIKKYIRFNEITKRFLEDSYNRLLGERKILGIHYRGTDFHKSYNKHPIQVNVAQVIEKVQECVSKNQYDAIFLATDDIKALKEFEDVFGEKILYYADVYRTDKDTSVIFSAECRENHRYKLGLEVLRDVYTLSKCKGLICGLSQVGFAAGLFKESYNEQYKDFFLINNGIHDNNNNGIYAGVR